MRKLHGHFNSGRILGNVAASIGRNRIITVVNPSNYNGDAFLHSVGLLRRPARKGVLVSNVSLAS